MEKNNELEKIRHSCEHVLTMAMLRLYPDIKMAMGPATDEGFYFDFDPNGEEVSENDFPKIEKEMQKIINADLEIRKEEIEIDKARDIFKNNPYKQEWLEEIEKEGEKATVYWVGDQFVDLCKGPHVKSTGKIKAFKLLSIAGAYWHGDEKNKMLTRIYGTAFASQAELDKYLEKLEQAKKRDHRRIGKKLKLFMFDNEVGQGLPLYLPKGAFIRHQLMQFALNTYINKGYQLVSTPHIGREKLWEHSGHLEFYSESMYGALEVDKEKYRLKPMNCPFHVKMYKHEIRSYRDLPVRYTEMGTVYRYEKSGELHGLTRPRAFTQDDAHIICTPEQLEKEVIDALKLTQYIYKTLGLEDLIFKLSTRDPENIDKYFGSNKGWGQAEETLRKALKKINVSDYETDVGGAAFYAPKIDIDAVDSMDRRWQLATIQIDFNLPKRFNMEYIDSKGQAQEPFVIHRALLGSLERFLGIYIEHTGGNFPVWLSPTQTVIIPITEDNLGYAQEKAALLKKEGIRVEVDSRSESMQKKIKEAEEQKIPYMLIIGNREEEADKVAVRHRKQGRLGSMSWNEFKSKIKKEIEKKQ